MSSVRNRRVGARSIVLALATALAASGCGILGGPEREDPAWALDAEAHRYYRPELIMQGPELLEEHYPEVADASPRWVTEGRFTDPAERAPIPAPDDYWWQAVVQLAPEQTAELTAESAAGAGDGGTEEGDGLETVPESEVLALLVTTLEGEVVPCEGDWVSVMRALARDNGSNISAAGDMIELAVVCESSGQLVTSSTDM